MRVTTVTGPRRYRRSSVVALGAVGGMANASLRGEDCFACGDKPPAELEDTYSASPGCLLRTLILRTHRGGSERELTRVAPRVSTPEAH